MEKELKDILLHRSYETLTPTERTKYTEWFADEVEFEQLKMTVLGAEMFRRNERVQPRPETKQRLDALFAEKHASKKVPFWYNGALAVLYPENKPFYRRPLIQVAAMLVVVLLTIPFLTTVDRQEQRLAKAEVPETEQPVVAEPEPEMKETQSVNVKQKDLKSDNPIRVEHRQQHVAMPPDLVETREEPAPEPDLMLRKNRAAESPAYNFSTAATQRVDAGKIRSDELEEVTVTQTLSASPAVSSIAITKKGMISDLHPEGTNEMNLEKRNVAVPLADQSGVLDLITATF